MKRQRYVFKTQKVPGSNLVNVVRTDTKTEIEKFYCECDSRHVASDIAKALNYWFTREGNHP